MSDKTFTERIEVAGNDLVERVKELARDADAKRVVIRDEHDKELLAFPLSWGVAGGAVAVLAAPLLAAVAAVGALASNVRLEVERTGQGPTLVDGPDAQDDPPVSGGAPHVPPPPTH